MRPEEERELRRWYGEPEPVYEEAYGGGGGKFPIVNLVLFLVTLLVTVGAGALQQGVNPLRDPAGLVEGLPFAATLMFILLTHELGHYFTSHHHRVDATLPYFIPAPSIIGTFGAFIKMRSPITTRRALVDIGASGPIAGFIVSIGATVVGLSMSEIVPRPVMGEAMGGILLGDSIIFKLLSFLVLGEVGEGSDVVLHPAAFAGWIGFFVTFLNLIPVGQLDGGHIAFALFGRKHYGLSVGLVAVLAVLGVLFWEGWAVWAFLLTVLGLRHPPVIYWERPLAASRQVVGWVALIIFLLTFMPQPIEVLM